MKPAIGNFHYRKIELIILLPLARPRDQFLMHLSTIDGSDCLQKKGLIMIECVFQISYVTSTGRVQPAGPVYSPRDVLQICMGMEQRLLVSSG